MKMNKDQEEFIAHIAYNLRVSSLISTTHAGSGHPTSCLSAAEIVATIFFYAMQFDPHDPTNPDNDRFILSKGHAAPLLYAVWKELGVLNEQDLLSIRQFNSNLEGHPTSRFSRSEAATGSLGQGLSIAVGMALAGRLDKKSFSVYVLMGDMETIEGSVWEAAELASYYRLNRLIAIVDCNELGQSEYTPNHDNITSYIAKFTAFGWHTLIVNGHCIQDLMESFDAAKQLQEKPIIILAKTIKGCGIKKIEGKMGLHGKTLNKDQLKEALIELKTNYIDSMEKKFSYCWKPALPITSNNNTINKTKGSNLSHHQPYDYKKEHHVATRKAYGEALALLGNSNHNIVALDAEVKNSTYAELFEKNHPKRFFQSFIAEQNMIGMATGLSLRGKIPFVSTFGAFFTRAYDQIRMAAIGRVPLRLVGSHAGVSIGEDGPSQMGLEDIAIMSCLPNSAILYPCDGVSTQALVSLMAERDEGITYLRTTRQETPNIYKNDEIFLLGGCKILCQSTRDIASIVAAGITLHEALKAYDMLKRENIFVTVIDAYCIKPLDSNTIISSARKSNNTIITVEDHYLEGGLGQLVAYAVRNEGLHITSLAVTQLPRSGSPNDLMAYEQIDASAIVNAVKSLSD